MPRRMTMLSDSAGDGGSGMHQNWGPNRSGASRGGSMRHHGGIGMIQRHADALGLTDDQHGKLEQMKVEFELEKVDKRAALRKAKIRMKAAFQNPKAGEAAVLAAIQEVGRCEGDLRIMRYRHLQAGRGMLNDQQHATLKGHVRSMASQKIGARRAAMSA